MISVVVSVRVIPEERERFLKAIGANAASAVRDEPGCIGFDVAEDVDEQNHFLLYEVYRDRDAIERHRATDHYAAWRKAAEACLVPGSQALHRAQVVYREVGTDS